MRRCVLLAGMALILVGCGSASALTGGGNAQSGSLLFVTQRCIQCHTVNGVGGDTATNLTGDLSAIDFVVMRASIVNPPSGMDYTKDLHLSDAQIHDLSAFVASSLKPRLNP